MNIRLHHAVSDIDGVTGMQSAAFDCFMEDLCTSQGVALRRCYENSFCLSADVCNAYDPNFPEVSEKRNESKINYGMGICKYTGSRGKYSTSDASAEIVGMVRKLFADNNVIWQMGELGKVDVGGGGTIAHFLAHYGMNVVDCGVGLFSMHAPYETAGKLDIYMGYKAYKAFFESK